MSGHNPHGHLGQQINQSWNHLQVPSYIPRHPQLAHMSNERPIRTPLSWPAPHSAEAMYGYMVAAAAAASSNHKPSPLDINPLLPAFVRSAANPMIPFGSVDLSLASRNSLTPSPRSLASPSAASVPTLNHNNPMSSINHCADSDEIKLLRNNLSEAQSTLMNPTSAIGDMQAAFLNSIVENSLNLNNSNVSDTLSQASNNEALSFASKEATKTNTNDEPMELVKEQNNYKLNSHENNQVNSTDSLIKPISQQQDQIFNAPLPGIPPHLSEISKSLLSIINSATNSPMLMPSMLPMPANTPPPPPLPINPSGVLNFLPQQQQSHLITHIDAEQNSLSKGSLSSASSTISSSKPVSTNDDSLDSLLGLGNGDEQDLKKVRCRRRKPQKTTRMSSDQPASELNTQLPNFSHSVPSNNDSSIDPKLLIDNGNGLTNYPPTNHSQGITPQTVTNYNQPSPQTQSMDLSNHCVLTDSHNAFRNGDFSDLPLKLANNMRNDLNGFNENKIYPRDFNSIGRTMDFSNNKFNPLNTDDLVKKVEEIVKCSDINGSLERQHTIKPSDHQTPGEQQHITQLNLNNKENGINLPPQSITSLITAPAVAKNYDETKCNGNKHFAGNVEKNTEMERRKTPIIDNESIRNNEDTDDLPILPVAEAKLPDTQPLPNSTPKDDSSFEDIKANLQNIFADIEEDEKTTFEKTNSSINSDSNVDKSNGDRDLKDSEMENEANVSTNSEKQVKDSEKTEESAPSNNSDNKASESNNDKSKSSNSDEKMNGKNSAEQQEASSTSIAPANNGQQEKPSKSNRRPLKKKPLVRRNNGTNGKGKKKMIASGGGGGRENDTTKNSHNGKKGFTGKTDKSAKVREESALDISNRFRGPYIQIQKDGSEVVINAPIAEDDAEKQSKIKNTFVKHHDRNKVRGLHVSTLSNKYDADTRDTTWMCVFCKLGPHKYGLGDLFGPFILSTTSEDFQLSQIDPREDIFKNQRSKLDMVRCKDVYVTPSKNTVIPSVNSNNLPSKKKRKFSEVETAANASTSGNAVASSSTSSLQPDIFYGMTKSISDSYEVWAHEDCVVWSSGVHIIGARIVGLEAAVWGSTRHQCVICLQYGAVLSCLKRGCTEVAHLPCAQRSQWQLNETEFKILCGNHKTITSTTTTSDDENLK